MLTPTMNKLVQKQGVKVCPMQEPPGYKLGDGKWMLNGPQGSTPSVEKTLYKVQDVNFDVIHIFNDELIDHYNRLYPDNTIVNTQYIDDLFVVDTQSEKVAKTIKLTTNLAEVKKTEALQKIISDYIELL